jgi:hypothetical protein
VPEHRTASQEEIRAHVKALPHAGRLTFLQKAAERGDRETVFAVVNAPSYLTGFDTMPTRDWVDTRRNLYSTLDPVRGTALAEMERLRDAAQRALGAAE